MNVFDVFLWAIESFGVLGNFFTTILFTEMPPIIAYVPLWGTLSLLGNTLAEIIISPVTLTGLWAWQTFKVVTA